CVPPVLVTVICAASPTIVRLLTPCVAWLLSGRASVVTIWYLLAFQTPFMREPGSTMMVICRSPHVPPSNSTGFGSAPPATWIMKSVASLSMAATAAAVEAKAAAAPEVAGVVPSPPEDAVLTYRVGVPTARGGTQPLPTRTRGTDGSHEEPERTEKVTRRYPARYR